MESHKKATGKHSHGDCPHENEACRKPVECFLLRDGFFYFYFMFENAGKTKEAHLEHLRISTREPLKQTVANLTLYPAPQASEHRLDRLSASSVYYFPDERSKNTFLYHPVNTQ